METSSNLVVHWSFVSQRRKYSVCRRIENGRENTSIVFFSPPPLFFFFFRRNFVVSRFALDLFMRVSFLLLLPLFSLSLSSSNRIQDRFAGGTRRIQYFSSRISRPFPPPPLIFRMHLGGLSSIPSRRQLQTRRPINVSGGGIWAKSRGERFLPAKLRVNDSPPSVNRLIDPPPQQLINQPFNRAFFPSLLPSSHSL